MQSIQLNLKENQHIFYAHYTCHLQDDDKAKKIIGICIDR